MIRVAARSDLAPGECKPVVAGTAELALCRIGDEFYAVDNSCPHQGGPLANGPLEGTVLTCPWHAWSFDVTTGEMPGHDRLKVRSYRVALDGDDVLVDLDGGPR